MEVEESFCLKYQMWKGVNFFPVKNILICAKLGAFVYMGIIVEQTVFFYCRSE